MTYANLLFFFGKSMNDSFDLYEKYGSLPLDQLTRVISVYNLSLVSNFNYELPSSRFFT